MLLKAGYVPTILFNTSSLLKTVLNKHKPRDEKFLLQQLCTPSHGTVPQVELSGILASLFRGEQLNQTNNLGILLVSELGFPFLKKTMAFAANCPISLMLVMLEEFISGFCDETAIEIRMRGIRRNLSPLKRLLFDAGII